MGIRYEKDTILNWINEMGKFLRLLVDKYQALEEPADPVVIEGGDREFFNRERSWFLEISDKELDSYLRDELMVEQVRPLALLFMHDGLLSVDLVTRELLLNRAKNLLNISAERSGSFPFEDYSNLATIDQALGN